MTTTNDKYREDLTAYLLEVATGNGYPEYCLACAGYLGMAVAGLDNQIPTEGRDLRQPSRTVSRFIASLIPLPLNSH